MKCRRNSSVAAAAAWRQRPRLVICQQLLVLARRRRLLVAAIRRRAFGPVTQSLQTVINLSAGKHWRQISGSYQLHGHGRCAAMPLRVDASEHGVTHTCVQDPQDLPRIHNVAHLCYLSCPRFSCHCRVREAGSPRCAAVLAAAELSRRQRHFSNMPQSVAL